MTPKNKLVKTIFAAAFSFAASLPAYADLIDLGTLGGTYSEPYAITSDGSRVVGNSAVTGGGNMHPFSYENGTLTQFDFASGILQNKAKNLMQMISFQLNSRSEV